jgi:hypothetical protein
MCAWPNPMTVDPSCVELLVPRDDRLFAAIDAVLAHACERAGLSGSEERDLSRAVSGACDEAFSLAARNGNAAAILHIVVCDSPNRVEVSIEQSTGEGPAEPEVPPSVRVQQKPDVVDAAPHEMNIGDLHHDMRKDRPRTVLVKHHATPNPQGHR